MSLDNQITLRGFVTAEPRLRQTTQTGTQVAEIRVGSTPRRLNRETGEWQDAPTSYYTVKCWRRLAINAVSSLKKGDMVVIRGRFYMRSWVDNQQRPRSVLEIEADSLGHDLAYGWSHFLRGTRPQTGRPADADEGERDRQETVPPGPDDDGDEYAAVGDHGELPEPPELPDAADEADAADAADAAEATDAAMSITESEEFDAPNSVGPRPGPGLTEGAGELELAGAPL